MKLIYHEVLSRVAFSLNVRRYMKDPIRPETAEAVALLRGAGVTVRMVTAGTVNHACARHVIHCVWEHTTPKP